jgi:hypothetical protein
MTGANEQVLQPLRDPIRGVSQVSFSLRKIALTRTEFTHPFLTDRSWRFDTGQILSNGIVDDDVNTELFPQFVSAVVLLNQLEIRLDDKRQGETLAAVIRDNASVSVGGIPVKTNANISPFYTPRGVWMASPLVIGVVVQRLPKIPNPIDALNW